MAGEVADVLSMSDEDFLKLDAPPVVEAPASTPVEEQQAAADTSAADPVKEPVVAEEQQPATPASEPTVPAAVEGEQQPATGVETPNQEGQPAVETQAADKPEGQSEFDYKAAYEGLMQPLKANGKEISLKNPQELVQLAQMGANYTRKMQELAPYRKTLMMLESNQLLDESKLAFLIDLSKKDPAAIQKYLKESGINPLDIDTEAESTYREGNHRVSDSEVAFRTALEDLSSTDVGKETIQVINSTWDQASKERLFTNPEIMQVMAQQRQAGFYDRIVGEIDRQRALGQLPAGHNWLQSYKYVGDQLVASGALDDLVAKQEPVPQTPPQVAAPVATRVLQPKPEVAPNAKVAAAAPTKVAAAPAQAVKNPLAMSDEEFLKQFQNRL